MKFLSVLALASAASGAAIQERQANRYFISDFKAGVAPHTTNAYFSFGVGDGTGVSSLKCGAFLPGYRDSKGVFRVPTVSEGKCGDSDNFTWSATRGQDGSLNVALKYTRQGRYSVLYCHQEPASAFGTQGAGTGFETEQYQGEQYFALDTSACTATL